MNEDQAPLMGKWRTSAPSTPKLDAALAKVQGDMTAAPKGATNPHFRTSYADLSSIIQAVTDPCSRYGVARYQPVWTNDRGEIVITTRIAHAGEWAEADLIMPVDKKNAQGVGSAITYGKRYGLAAMLGVATVDDDGNGAAASPPPRRPAPPERRASKPKPPTLREQVVAQVEKVSQSLRLNLGAAWSECLAAAELPSDLGGDQGPNSDAVTPEHLASLLRASHEVLGAGVSDPDNGGGT